MTRKQASIKTHVFVGKEKCVQYTCMGSCREKEAKLKEAKAALTMKQTSARRLERAFQALHENSVLLVRLASVLSLGLTLSRIAANQSRVASISSPPTLPPGACMLQPQGAVRQSTVVHDTITKTNARLL